MTIIGLVTTDQGPNPEFVEAFQLPAVFHEIASEPVEQLGMTGTLAELAEVAGGIHDAAAKVMQPKTVHQNARGEWMIAIGQSFGKC